jgi:hypothetical protein
MSSIGKEIPSYVNMEDSMSIKEHAKKLECTEKELIYCIKKVGKSVRSIELYLEMNRDFVEYVNQATEPSTPKED